MASKKKSSSKKPATLKVQLWTYMSNQGDGSAVAKYFNTEAEAEHYASFDDERFCDDIYRETFELDPKTLKLVKIPKNYREEDEENDDE